jgi:hypothetical protein
MDECRGEPRREAAQDRKPVIDAADEPIAGSEKDEIGGNGFGAGEAGGVKPVVAAFCATAIKAITAKVGASGRMPGSTSPRFDAR